MVSQWSLKNSNIAGVKTTRLKDNIFWSQAIAMTLLKYMFGRMIEIFDIVYDCIKRQGGIAYKGSARNSKVGEGKCGKDTIIYAIATEYYGKSEGQSSFDPLFVIAAIMDWANIASNERGYMELIRRDL